MDPLKLGTLNIGNSQNILPSFHFPSSTFTLFCCSDDSISNQSRDEPMGSTRWTASVVFACQ